MRKIIGCEHAQNIRKQTNPDGNLEMHVADCAECLEARKVADWMQKFAARTAPPRNLPAPGLILFKARLLEKYSAARRAVQPIFWMQIASALIVAAAVLYLQAKSGISIGAILTEPFASLSPAVQVTFFGLMGAILICLTLAYFLRGTKELKNGGK